MVEQHGWLDDTRFSASIALAQAAPGPNLLFVPVLFGLVHAWLAQRRDAAAARRARPTSDTPALG